MSLYIIYRARRHGDPCYVFGEERTKNVIYRQHDQIWGSWVSQPHLHTGDINLLLSLVPVPRVSHEYSSHIISYLPASCKYTFNYEVEVYNWFSQVSFNERNCRKRPNNFEPVYLSLFNWLFLPTQLMQLNVKSKANFGVFFIPMKNRLRNMGYLCRLKILRLFWESFVKEMTMFSVFFFTKIVSLNLENKSEFGKELSMWVMVYLLPTLFLLDSIMPTSGHEEVYQLLLEQGADANAQTRLDKVSSLHRAAYSGHMSVEWWTCSSNMVLIQDFVIVITKLLWFEMNVGWSGFEIVSFLWCFPLFQRNYCQ